MCLLPVCSSQPFPSLLLHAGISISQTQQSPSPPSLAFPPFSFSWSLHWFYHPAHIPGGIKHSSSSPKWCTSTSTSRMHGRGNAAPCAGPSQTCTRVFRSRNLLRCRQERLPPSVTLPPVCPRCRSWGGETLINVSIYKITIYSWFWSQGCELWGAFGDGQEQEELSTQYFGAVTVCSFCKPFLFVSV